MKQFVIGDIHGCSKTLGSLLEKVAPSKEDQIIFVGDYIDKGPDSGGVLDQIINIIRDGFNVIPLTGNHEENLLEALDNYSPKDFRNYVVTLCKAGNLINENGELIERYETFLRSLPLYHQTDDYFIVHAGLDFRKADLFEDRRTLLEIRGFAQHADISRIGNRKIIHGHVPTPMEQTMTALENKEDVIPIDTGCVYNRPHKIHDHTKMGHLTCFELNSKTLFFQPNIDT
jgi:serine/threonine protein phosphatase 1